MKTQPFKKGSTSKGSVRSSSNKKPFAPPTKGTQDKIKLAGMPSRLYFEKIMQRIRKDPRWHMGQAPAKTPE